MRTRACWGINTSFISQTPPNIPAVLESLGLIGDKKLA
jgi:hypothetical protein